MNEKHFDFGRNWQAFSLHSLNTQKVDAATSDFLELMRVIKLEDASFLDIGFGQGLSLLCATEAGARTVGLDINPLCAEVINENRRFFPNLSTKPIPTVVGSILDQTTLERIRTISPDSSQTYDIVHAWGVLHHTGNMTAAMLNAASLVKPDGFLVIAIYNRHWSSPIWRMIKRLYCLSPDLIKKIIIYSLYPIIWIAKFLVTGKPPSQKSRGMDFFYDVIDWIGGYPYEYATVSEVKSMMEHMGFDCLRAMPAQVPTGCNEFIFRRRPQLPL